MKTLKTSLFISVAMLAQTTVNAQLSGVVTSTSGSPNVTSFGTFTSAQLGGAVSDETGSGAAVFATSPIFTTNITTPLIVGGTATNSPLIYKTTTGAGAAGADHIFRVGNNGAKEAMRILNNGNVGIGTNAPNTNLHIVTSNSGQFGGILLETAGAGQGALLQRKVNAGLFLDTWMNSASSNWAEFGLTFEASTTNPTLGFNAYTGSFLNTGAAIHLLTFTKNAVGIGTLLANNPNNYLLAVNGTIGAKAIKVEASSTTWSDYVFEKNYALKTIPELEAFINTNKHLPNVPSACEVEEKGIDMATMDATLLAKIEELSLYLIEMNKKIERLEAKNTELENAKK